MTFPDRIERTVRLARPPREVWSALTTAEGLSAWFGERATIDLRPGGAASMTFAGGITVEMRVERVEEPSRVRLHLAPAGPARRRPAPDLRRVHPRTSTGTAPCCASPRPASPNCPSTPARRPTTRTTRAGRGSWPSWWSTSMAPDLEAIAEQVFVALADPTRRAILAALATDGPATVTDLAARLPITRQAIAKHLALMTDAGLVTPEARRAPPSPLPAALRTGAARPTVPRRTRQPVGRPARRPATTPHRNLIEQSHLGRVRSGETDGVAALACSTRDSDRTTNRGREEPWCSPGGRLATDEDSGRGMREWSVRSAWSQPAWR